MFMYVLHIFVVHSEAGRGRQIPLELELRRIVSQIEPAFSARAELLTSEPPRQSLYSYFLFLFFFLFFFSSFGFSRQGFSV